MSQDPSKTPEHDARSTDGEDMHPEVRAAYRYVGKVLRSSVGVSGGHVWYCCSMREVFLAGCSHVHSRKPESKPEPKQEERFIEFTRAFPPTALTIKADGKTLDALIEKECISLFDVDRILRDQVPVEGVVHGDTGFQVQWKEGSGTTEPDPDTDPVYHWEVRDMEDQFQAGGQASTLHEAMSSARSYAYQYAPCKVRVWTEKTIHEANF